MTAKAGDQQVVLAWGPPTSNGSTAIDHYTVTVTPGGQSLQTKAISATVAGLTNQTTYTFNVTATNLNVQTGPAASASATPSPPPFLSLVPAFGPGDAKISVGGHQFTPNQAITLDWDGDQTVVVGSAQADTTGSFNVDVRPPANAAAGPHKICATVDPQPCGNFTVTGPAASPSPAPSPTPSPSASPTTSSNPSPSSSPSPSAPTLTGFDLISRPPFVFLPILAVLALLGAIAFWIFGRRPPPSLPSATVLHRSVRPETAAPFVGGAAAAAAPPPAEPPAPEPPAPEAPPPEPPPPEPPPPAPPHPSGPPDRGSGVSPDEPPDLPEPGE